MDDRRSDPHYLSCPAAASDSVAFFPGKNTLPAPPPVDERLARPNTRTEILDGEKLYAQPADEPHGSRHGDVASLFKAHTAPQFVVAVDMLTRTSTSSDFAPDVSVYPAARDPDTGGRMLEELAFEITSKQSIGVPTRKAQKLVERGVRRVFCVLVEQGRVLEWSRETDGWSPLPATGVIEDHCLVRPLPVAALLDQARVLDEMARALLVQRPPSLEEALTRKEEEGRKKGRKKWRKEGRKEGERSKARELIVLALEERGIAIDDEVRAAIAAEHSRKRLDRWMRRAMRATTAREVIAEEGDTSSRG